MFMLTWTQFPPRRIRLVVFTVRFSWKLRQVKIRRRQYRNSQSERLLEGLYKYSRARQPPVINKETQVERTLVEEQTLLLTSGMKTSELVTGLRFDSN